MGIIIENGVAKIQKIVAGFIQTSGLEVGSKETPTGFVLYDEATKEPYCVSINNGEIVKTQGKCELPVTDVAPVVDVQSRGDAPTIEPVATQSETISTESIPAETTITPTETSTSEPSSISPEQVSSTSSEQVAPTVEPLPE